MYKMYLNEAFNEMFFTLKEKFMSETFVIERHNYNRKFFEYLVYKEINNLCKQGNEAAIEIVNDDNMSSFIESVASFFWSNLKVVNMYEKEERDLEKYIFNDYDIEDYERGSFELTKKAFNEMLEGLTAEYFYCKDDIDKGAYNYLEYLFNASIKNGIERYPYENEYRYNYGYLYMVRRFEKIVEFRLDSEM